MNAIDKIKATISSVLAVAATWGINTEAYFTQDTLFAAVAGAAAVYAAGKAIKAFFDAEL